MPRQALVVAILVGLSLLPPPQVEAGGDAVVATIRQFARQGESNASFTVAATRPLPTFTARGKWQDCGELRVVVHFDPAAMTSYRFTAAEHAEALRALGRAAQTGGAIEFGYMGGGWRVLNDRDPCLVESQGLTISTDSRSPVFSYFRPPLSPERRAKRVRAGAAGIGFLVILVAMAVTYRRRQSAHAARA